MKKKSIYYRLLMHFYKTGDNDTKEFIKYILEQQAIKRGLNYNNCSFKI